MEKVVIFTYRYLWKVNGNDSISVKIISDVKKGHEEFVAHLLGLENLESAGREYLHEYDVSLLAKFETLKENCSNEKV